MNSTAERAYRERQGQRAAVRATPYGLIIEASSGRGITSPDPDAFHAFLPLNADDESIGSAVMSALAASRFLSVSEANAFTRDESDVRWINWVSAMLQAAGVRTEASLFKRMALCHVAAKGQSITLSPTAKRRGAAWEGLGIEQQVEVSMSAGPLGVATALRQALLRCSPEVAL